MPNLYSVTKVKKQAPKKRAAKKANASAPRKRKPRVPKGVTRKKAAAAVAKATPKLEQAVKNIVSGRKPSKQTGVVSVVTTPSSVTVPWDKYSLRIILETLCSHYATGTDLFGEITPLNLVYYSTYIIMSYFNGLGCLTGGKNFLTNVERSKLAVPYALAKWMEYNAPYDRSGVSASNGVVWADNTIIASTIAPPTSSVGAFTSLFLEPDYPDGVFGYVPNWAFSPQASTAYTDIAGGDAPQMLSFLFTAEGVITFDAFCLDTVLIRGVSSALTNRKNVIPLSQVPTKAPDSSAYARCTVSPLLDPSKGGIMSINNDYDPELASFFAPTLIASDSYAYTTKKSYVSPSFNPNVFPPSPPETNPYVYFPDYMQIASMWVFLAQHSQTPYKSGRFRDVFTFEGVPLSTMYPKEQPAQGVGIGEIFQQVHSQLIASKATDATPASLDPQGTNLCYGATATYAAMQSRRNKVEVFHIQCPSPFTINDQRILYPQIMYTDSTWDSINPALIAAVVSAQGPVVDNGQLVIPYTDFQGVVTNSQHPVGPQEWSAYGFGWLSDTDYTIPTTLTTPWGTRTAPTENNPPNMVWDDSVTPPIICDVTFVNDWYGSQNPGPAPGFPYNTYPIFPTGGAATTIANLYKTWLQTDTYGQSIPIASVNTRDSGDVASMTTTQIVDPRDVTVVTSNPNGMATDSVPIVAVTGGPSEMSSSIPLEPVGAAFAALSGLGNSGTGTDKDANTRSRYLRMKRAYLKKLAIPTDLIPGANNGPHNVDIPWSTGKSGLLSSLAQQFTTTSSAFSAKLATEQQKPDYDIVSLVKQYAGPLLKQSMSSVPSTKMVPATYLRHVSTALGPNNKLTLGNLVQKGKQSPAQVPPPDPAHKAWGMVEKGIGGVGKTIGGIIDIGSKIGDLF